ncbi:MAG: hypothetical protein IKY78_11005 [Clostridia bacterium]|nr:hypothetical protein [Clostridia bacterium]
MVTDNIIIERIWQDDEFFQVSITCQTNIIEVTSNVYIQDANINDLINILDVFLGTNIKETSWLCGEIGANTTPGVLLKFIKIDRLGHIKIEVFLELDDGSLSKKHCCSFFVFTEHGQLLSFKNSLNKLKEKTIGRKVALTR